ncbi:NTP transferase domain-containing protein [Cellulomonas sp. JZ18]|nr:NTP transferase domain-containing protein [Cellulomonas sp. JZ18]
MQARAGSTRFPGKVLVRLGERPVLAWVVRAALAASGVDEVVVATSDTAADDAVAALAEELGVRAVRGPELDVVERFAIAAEVTRADAVVRLTADCPLLDPTLVQAVVGAWRADPSLEYVASTLVRTLPRGLDVELLSRPALEHVRSVATGADRVHVTSRLYAVPGEHRTLGLVEQDDASDLRVTLDTPEDLALLRAVVDELGDQARERRALVALLRARPDLTALNAHVRQKRLEDG